MFHVFFYFPASPPFYLYIASLNSVLVISPQVEGEPYGKNQEVDRKALLARKQRNITTLQQFHLIE